MLHSGWGRLKRWRRSPLFVCTAESYGACGAVQQLHTRAHEGRWGSHFHWAVEACGHRGAIGASGHTVQGFNYHLYQRGVDLGWVKSRTSLPNCNFIFIRLRTKLAWQKLNTLRGRTCTLQIILSRNSLPRFTITLNVSLIIYLHHLPHTVIQH